MLTISQIRLMNFLALYREFEDAMPDTPQKDRLKAFSEHVGLSERYLCHLRTGRKYIGQLAARRIEHRMGRPEGWMDSLPGDGKPRVINPQRRELPPPDATA